MAQKFEIIDRTEEAMGGQSYDRPRSAAKRIGWHYSAVMRSINKHISGHEQFWRDKYGWDRGGYHFWIDTKGRIHQNYIYERMTWGVANNNWDTVHICLEAGNADDYSPEQIAARDWLTRKVMKDLNIPASNVMGHWEIYNNTACPGYTRLEMDNFRAQLAKPVAVVAGSAVHKVQKGDTLYSLAKKYGMTVDQLKQLNGLDSHLIVTGQELKVKGNAPKQQKPALKPLDVVAQEVIDGKWKNWPQREKLLEEAGYNYHDVQATVDRLQAKNKLLPLETIAREVIEGKHGDGAKRKTNLEALGYNYNEVQAEVNKLVQHNTPKQLWVKLSSAVSSWSVYPLGVQPIYKNRIGALNPKMHAPMSYRVVGWEDNNQCAIIQTQDFGKVKIYIDGDASFENR